jgi:hypothetical protein
VVRLTLLAGGGVGGGVVLWGTSDESLEPT